MPCEQREREREIKRKAIKMLIWLFIQYLRDARVNPPFPVELTTTLAFLASFLADGNLLTDWLYYRFIADGILNQKIILPEWIRMLHLLTCLFGTLSYLGIATDGKIINLIRSALLLTPALPVLLLFSIFAVCHSLIEGILVQSKKKSSSSSKYDGSVIQSFYQINNWAYHKEEWIMFHLLVPIWDYALQRREVLSSDTLKILALYAGDISQIFVAFFTLKGKLESNGTSSTSCHVELPNILVFHLFFTVFDILHKFALICDMRSVNLRNDDIHLPGREQQHTRLR